MKSGLIRHSGSGRHPRSYATEGKSGDSEGFVVFRPWKDREQDKAEDRKMGFRLYNCEVPLVRKTLEGNGFKEAEGKEQWSVLWGVGLLRSSLYLTLSRIQKINHFPRSMEMTRKDCLFKNLAKMQALHTSRHYGFFPSTFILPSDSPSLISRMTKHTGEAWIVKPSAGSQGKGITIIRSIGEIPVGHNYVASHYIDKPLLVTGRKFDLRIYVAMTSVNPLRLYVYREGLVRFAVLPYDNTSLDNQYIHLTNYSVNKTHARYSTAECKWTLTQLKSHLVTHHNIEFAPLWAKIKDIIIKTVISIENTVNSAVEMYVPHRGNCFELLGFDILLDEQLNAWLLEVNLSPSLRCDAEVDVEVKGQLIADLLTLIGIRRTVEPRDNSISPIKRSTRPYMSTSKDMSLEGQLALKDTLEEGKRMGNFERIFPCETAMDYIQFFDEPRPLNIMLIEQVVRRKEPVPQRQIKLRPLEWPQRIPRLKREPWSGGNVGTDSHSVHPT